MKIASYFGCIEGGGGGDSVSGPLNACRNSIASSLLLFLLIFGMSATVDMKNLRNQLHNRWAIVTGVVMQFVLVPLLGYLNILALRHGHHSAHRDGQSRRVVF